MPPGCTRRYVTIPPNPVGSTNRGLRRTEFNFAGQTVSHLVKSKTGKIEFCTSEPGMDTRFFLG